MERRPLLIVFLIILLDAIGFGILIPVIPELFNQEGQFYLMPGSAWFYQNRFFILGLLTACYPIAQFFASPILGQISDKYGRRRVLIVSILGTCISYVVFGLGIHLRSIPILFVARILDGVTGGNISTAQAVIADVSSPENRQKNFGLIGAAFGLGFILGPFIGGVLASSEVVSWFDASTPFMFAALLSLTNVTLVSLILPETNTHPTTTLRLTPSQSLRNIMKVFSYRSVFPLFVTGFLLQGGFTFYTTFASTYLDARFGISERDIGMFFAYVGVWIVITQGIILRRIAGKFSDYKLVRFVLPSIALALAVYPLVNSPIGLLFVVPFYAVPLGIANATIIGLISRSVGPKIQGEILGVNASVLALAMSLPPILAGTIASVLSPSASIWGAAIIIAVAAMYFWRSYRPHSAHPLQAHPPIASH